MDIILNWDKTTDQIKLDTKDKILKECIWLNKRIQVKGTSLYSNHSMRKGILYIADLIDEHGVMMSHTVINTKYTATMTFLDLLRIRLTIPHDWKEILSGNVTEETEPDLLYSRLNNLKTLKTKHLYEILLEKEHDCTTPSNAQTYWQNKYKINDETMKVIYKLPYKATKLTSLQSLQYKILHKIINCNYWLYKIHILDSPKCRYC
jgi:hypothetical protein